MEKKILNLFLTSAVIFQHISTEREEQLCPIKICTQNLLKDFYIQKWDFPTQKYQERICDVGTAAAVQRRQVLRLPRQQLVLVQRWPEPGIQIYEL